MAIIHCPSNVFLDAAVCLSVERLMRWDVTAGTLQHLEVLAVLIAVPNVVRRLRLDTCHELGVLTVAILGPASAMDCAST